MESAAFDGWLSSLPDDFSERWPLWLGEVRMAYEIARGERLGELRGRRVSRFDARGLHPYSEAWGKIAAAMHPQLVTFFAERGDEGHSPLSPTRLRALARSDAEAEFARRVRDGEEVFG